MWLKLKHKDTQLLSDFEHLVIVFGAQIHKRRRDMEDLEQRIKSYVYSY